MTSPTVCRSHRAPIWRLRDVGAAVAAAARWQGRPRVLEDAVVAPAVAGRRWSGAELTVPSILMPPLSVSVVAAVSRAVVVGGAGRRRRGQVVRGPCAANALIGMVRAGRVDLAGERVAHVHASARPARWAIVGMVDVVSELRFSRVALVVGEEEGAVADDAAAEDAAELVAVVLAACRWRARSSRPRSAMCRGSTPSALPLKALAPLRYAALIGRAARTAVLGAHVVGHHLELARPRRVAAASPGSNSPGCWCRRRCCPRRRSGSC